MSAPALIATVGAANANSFGTLAEADTYHNTVLHAKQPWPTDIATVDDKTRALIMATQWMTSLICWTGFYATNTQALPWPRNSMWARNDMVAILPTVIPDEVKAAQFELARLLYYKDRTTESDVLAQGLKALKAGPVSLEFSVPVPQAKVLAPIVENILVPSWIDFISEGGSNERELVRA